jgi:hypothetical protein
MGAFTASSDALYRCFRSNRLAGSQRAPFLRQLLLRLNFNRSGNMQGTCREHAEDMQGTCREHAGNMQGTCREHAGNMQGTV